MINLLREYQFQKYFLGSPAPKIYTRKREQASTQQNINKKGFARGFNDLQVFVYVRILRKGTGMQ